VVRIGALRLCPSKIIRPDPTLMPSLDPSVHISRDLVVILLKLSKVRETFRGVLTEGWKLCGPQLSLGARALRDSQLIPKFWQVSRRRFRVGPRLRKM